MSRNTRRTDRNAHPGWGVQFEDGSWLGGAHGWFRTDDAFYADTYDTEEEGINYLESVRKDDPKYFGMPAKVVPAWQVLCAQLHFDNEQLRKASKITPDEIWDIKNNLEDALRILEDTRKNLEKE